jgi:hypothetical protein
MPDVVPPPTDKGPAQPRERLARFVIGCVVIVVWFAVSMKGATDATSWEHHPFGGPFTLLKGSRSGVDYALSWLILASILTPAAAWMWTGSFLPAFLSIVISCLSVWMTICLAAWASC